MDNFDDDEVRKQYFDMSLQMWENSKLVLKAKTDIDLSIVEQPFKTPFIAAIVIAINRQKPEVVQQLLEREAKAAQDHLEAGQWREVKLVLRFLACLQGLLAEDGLFPLLEELFSRAVDLQTASSEDVSNLAQLVLPSELMRSSSEPGLRTRQNYLAYDTLHYGFVRSGL